MMLKKRDKENKEIDRAVAFYKVTGDLPGDKAKDTHSKKLK